VYFNLYTLIGTIRRNIFRKVRKETILKLYNTLVVPAFLYGSENWTLTESQRRRIEAAEMKLLRSVAGHTLIPLNAELNPIRHLLGLARAHHFVDVSQDKRKGPQNKRLHMPRTTD
jgi:hypothetical protein